MNFETLFEVEFAIWSSFEMELNSNFKLKVKRREHPATVRVETERNRR